MVLSMDRPLERPMNMPSLHPRRLLLAAGAIAMTATIGASSAADVDANGNGNARGCAAQFELAQRLDMESFRDYDAQTFRDGHHPDAVTVFASGAVRKGIDAIMTALGPHFANREAVWSWTELYRVVDGCKSAFILYDATYDIPSIGYHQRTLTGVSYTHQGNKWLSIADQSTYLEAPGP
jgi:hypothetical protein